MKHKFDVGQRVVWQRAKGEIVQLKPFGHVAQVRFDLGGEFNVPLSECRRLVKKKKSKREPRVVYIPGTDEAMFSTRWYNKAKCEFLYPNCKAVKFIEVIE